ncbi:MAG: hypothetical protein IPK60_15305 [Sandaracinaceae bacterium]|jgi:hypothetical protein|nr:hypothetical protein [Sandaracinaceae bacterium]
MRSLLTRSLWMGVLFMLAGCSKDGQLISVQVVTALVPGQEFLSVETDLLDNGNIETGSRTLARVEARALRGDAYGPGRAVAEFGDLDTGEHTVRVRLRKADGSILIERRTRVTITGNYIMRVYLTRDCVGVTCPAPAGSPGLSECQSGHCVDPRCDPQDESTREFCPEVPFCSTVSTCEPVAACASQQCLDGICTPLPVADACSTSEYCNPETENGGCAPYSSIGDDAGVDGGGIICNAICIPESSPCVFGSWDCGDGDAGSSDGGISDGGIMDGGTGASPSAPVCTFLQNRLADTVCGTDMVCDGMGACVAAAP